MAPEFMGFNEDDFETFSIEDFEARMTTIKEMVRPKLEQLGRLLAPWLENQTGIEFYSHVATHARRRVNAPDATWVAIGGNERGYKSYAHFEVGIEYERASVDFWLKAAAKDKKRFAQELSSRGPALLDQADAGRFDVKWRDAHGADGQVLDRRLDSMEAQDLEAMSQRLNKVKSSSVDIGISIPRAEAVIMSPEQLLETFKDCLLQLMPLYTAAVGLE